MEYRNAPFLLVNDSLGLFKPTGDLGALKRLSSTPAGTGCASNPFLRALVATKNGSGDALFPLLRELLIPCDDPERHSFDSFDNGSGGTGLLFDDIGLDGDVLSVFGLLFDFFRAPKLWLPLRLRVAFIFGLWLCDGGGTLEARRRAEFLGEDPAVSTDDFGDCDLYGDGEGDGEDEGFFSPVSYFGFLEEP
eukprot:CAMPEP_0184485214 /NCGR_PEP_ID=MMETSP0113_2-20130426/6852_1 /TAXON_ID=91329 /ORGANISM="Norrisiella sphaerica, Strain BC52" /LENGTH=191 /DNA_ID=CAMNT_0026866567 /DNA_START=325 /DNA_END=901 /DNA_ORIENTATION=+